MEMPDKKRDKPDTEDNPLSTPIKKKTRFGLRVLFIIGLILGIINILMNLAFTSLIQDTIVLSATHPIGLLIPLVNMLFVPIVLIWVSVAGLLLTK